MSLLETDTGARPTAAETKPQPEFAHHPSGRVGDDSNPYSPVSCILLLLIAGLIIRFGPAIHAYLYQN